jgi:hypothetical protein
MYLSSNFFHNSLAFISFIKKIFFYPGPKTNGWCHKLVDAGQQWGNRINGKRDRNKQNKP